MKFLGEMSTLLAIAVSVVPTGAAAQEVHVGLVCVVRDVDQARSTETDGKLIPTGDSKNFVLFFPAQNGAAGSKLVYDPARIFGDALLDSVEFNRESKGLSVLLTGTGTLVVVQTLDEQIGKRTQQASIIRSQLDERGSVSSPSVDYVGGCQISATTEPDTLFVEYRNQLEAGQ